VSEVITASNGDPANNDDLDDSNVIELDLFHFYQHYHKAFLTRDIRRYEGTAEMIPPKHVTVLGGGLTGLTTAYRLTTHLPATKVTLIDSAKRTGGWIDSVSRKVSVPSTQGDENEKRRIVEGDVVTESGPRSIRPRGSPGAAGMLQLVRCCCLLDRDETESA